MKLSVYLALIGSITALENASGEGKDEVAVWEDSYVFKYFHPNDRKCKRNADCGNTNYGCIKHQWEYNNQQESAQGCWHTSVCKDRSFYMFDGRMIQFWCDPDSMATPSAEPLAYPIWPAGEDHWDEWEKTCSNHDECRNRNGKTNQHCTDFTWDATDDSMSYSTGTACYSWDYNRCTAEQEPAAAAGAATPEPVVGEEQCPPAFPNCGSDGDCTTAECAGGCAWSLNTNYKMGAGVSSSFTKCKEHWVDNTPAGETFAIENVNYGTTKFSFYTQLWCKGGADWGFMAMEPPVAEAEEWEEGGDWNEDGDWSDDDRRGGDRGDTTSNLVVEQYEDGSMRIEMIMGATKLAATAATALLATTLY